MIGPDLESARPAAGEGFADSVSFWFGDAEGGVCGMARIGLSGEGASAVALLFQGRDPVAVATAGPVAATGTPWDAVEAGGVRASVEVPLQRWTLAWDDGAGGFELEFRALAPPLEAAAVEAGLQGYEQPCAVTGSVETPAGRRAVACLGSRSHTWGAVDWRSFELVRGVRAWLSPADAILLSASRPAGAEGHDEESVRAALIEDGTVLELDDARLSTTYDASGRHVRAGIELWPGAEGAWARRAAGRAVAGATLELGRLRFEAAFYEWRMDGLAGMGAYDLLRVGDA